MDFDTNDNANENKNESKRVKRQVKKKTAALISIFLGGLGIHKFYLRRYVQGIIYILFCWTRIPIGLGIIEGIILFVMKDEKFNDKYNNPSYVRPKWQKRVATVMCCIAAGVVLLFGIAVYQGGELDRLIKAGKYEEAKALLDKQENTTKRSHEKYAKLYAAQGLYDEAAIELLNYFKYEDLLDIEPESVKLIDSYAAKASDEVKAQADEFSEKYIAAQAEKSKLAQAKAEADAARSEAEKLKEEAAKSTEEANAAKAEADKSKADAEKAQEEATRSTEEANAAKAEADKSKADAEKAKAEADRSTEEANAAKAEADRSTEEANAAKAEADKSKSDAEKAKAEADKSKADAANSSASGRQSGSDTPSKSDIEKNVNFDFDYSAAMHYSEKMNGSYVMFEMKLGSEIGGTHKGTEFLATIAYLDDHYPEGIRYDMDERFVIKDMRKDKERSWVEGDVIFVWGKYVGIASGTYYTTNPYTNKKDPVKRPVIEIYYDELF